MSDLRARMDDGLGQWADRESARTGTTKADQSDLPYQMKRCTWQTSERCQERDGVHPLDDYYDSTNGLGDRGKVAHCRFCSMEASRKWAEENADRRRAQARRYKNERYRDDHYFRVVEDPTGHFSGTHWPREEFRADRIEQWPEGMVVLDPEIGETMPVADAAWMPNRKLTAGDVREIRTRLAEDAVTFTSLADEFSVSRQQIGRIARGEQWEWVESG